MQTSTRAALQALLLLTLLSVAVRAQTSNTDGMTPAGLTPGAPAGSYALSGFENVNLYNGNLNVSLPLLPVSGRGSAGYTATLLIEQKWRVEQFAEPFPGQQPVLTPNGNWWGELKPGYGPGVLEGRRGGYGNWQQETYCGSTADASRVYLDMLTRLTFTAGDGTEYELRDLQTGGQPINLSSVPCGSNGNSRGRVFVTADGSAATFVSDTAISDYKWKPMGLNDQFRPSGYLWLRDGTRYRIDNGLVSWLNDRNGNRVTFSYSADRITSATDSLNRQVTFSYASGTVAYDQISFNGFGGQARSLKIWKASMGSVLRSGYTLQTYAQLFPDFTGASSSTQFNPSKVSAVELPNGRTYQFRYNSYGELARIELPTGGAMEYDWINANTIMAEGVIYRRVSERRLYKDGVNLENKVTYSNPGLGAGVEVRTFNSAGTLLAYSRHYHCGSALDSLSSPYTTPISYPLNLAEGRETQTDVFSTNGTTVLRRVQNTWDANGALGDGQSIHVSQKPCRRSSHRAPIWYRSRSLLTINTTIRLTFTNTVSAAALRERWCGARTPTMSLRATTRSTPTHLVPIRVSPVTFGICRGRFSSTMLPVFYERRMRRNMTITCWMAQTACTVSIVR
jgi:YD repeat-containing protein